MLRAQAEENKVAVARSGCLPALVSLVRSDDRERERYAARAISNLAEMLEGRTQRKMLEEGALDALLRLTDSPLEDIRREVFVAAMAAGFTAVALCVCASFVLQLLFSLWLLLDGGQCVGRYCCGCAVVALAGVRVSVYFYLLFLCFVMRRLLGVLGLSEVRVRRC